MSAALIYQRSPTVAIELLEDYPCDTKQELAARERYWIEKFRAEGITVVNHNIPTAGLTEDEIRIRRNTQKRERARANLYHCPCGKTIQSAQKEEHLASYLHAKRLKIAQWVEGDLSSFSFPPLAMDVSSSAGTAVQLSGDSLSELSSPTQASTWTSPGILQLS